jgi:hypothetical protein
LKVLNEFLMASETLSKMGAWWKTSSIIRRFKHAR